MAAHQQDTVRKLRFYLAVSAVSFGFASVAQAEDHTLTDLKYDLGMFKISIPKLEIRGTTLDRAALDSLMDFKSTETAVQRLSRLNASTILMPELHLDQDIGGQKQRTSYFNTTATDIANGKIVKAITLSTKAVINDATIGVMNQSIGLTTAEGVDLAAGARFLTEAAKPGEPNAFQTLYKSYEIRDYAIEIGKIGTIKLASVKGRDARVRQSLTPVSAIFTDLMEFTKKQTEATAKGEKSKEPTKDELRQIAGVFTLLEDFEYGDMDAVGLTGKFTSPDGPVDLKMDRMFFSDKPGQGDFRLEGLDLKGGPLKATLASFSASGFSFTQSLRVMADAFKSDNFEAAIGKNPLKLIPKLGSIKTSGLFIEAPVDTVKTADGKREIQKLGLKGSEITVNAQRDGIPTAIKLSIDGLSMPLLARDKRDGLKDLLALGYKSVDLSSTLEGAWIEAKNEFTLSSLSLSGVDMGSINISGLLGNISKDVFSGDAALTQVALLGASAKALDIKIQDKSLFGRILERDSKAKKKSVDDLRKEFGMIAAVGLPAILGPSDGAKAISAAVSRFVAKPGTLSVSAMAKTPSGIGLADVIAIGEPQAVFDKLDIKATAE